MGKAPKLRDACLNGDLKAARARLKAGASVNVSDEEGMSLVHCAVIGENVEILRLLVARGADIFVRANDGRTPLHCAARLGQLDAVQFLVEHGLDVNDGDEDGDTVFLYAALGGDVEVLQYLLEHGANPHALMKDGRTALHCAAAEEHTDAVKLLVKQGIALDLVDEDGYSVLHYVAAGGDVELIQILLEHGADPHVVMTDGRTALHCAAQQGHTEAAEYLMKLGLTIDLVDDAGFTVFHYAAFTGDIRAMQLLMENGADIRAVTNDGRTALHLAAQEASVEAVKFLMDLGLAVNANDNDDDSVFDVACECGNEDVVKYLIENGVDTEHQEKKNIRRLHKAAAEGCPIYYLDLGVPVNSVDEDGMTAIHWAAAGGHVDALEVLIDRGADVHAVTYDGRTALHCAAIENEQDTVEYLIEAGLAVDAVDEDGDSVLHFAAEGGDIDIMQMLIDHGADPLVTTKEGETILHRAARAANVDAVAFLADQGLDIQAVENDGKSVFHHAAIGGSVEVLQYLMKQGADYRVLTKDRRTALHCAARETKLDAVRFLLEEGFAAGAADEDGDSVLHYAAMGGDITVMEVLIEHGADVHAVTKDGRTVLHCAATNGNDDAVNFLLGLGLSIDAKQEDGGSVLHKAALTGDVRTLRTLIKSGADMHSVGEDGWTLLHYAAQSGKVDAVIYVLALGVEVDAQGDRGDTALHRAAKEGNIGIMRVLIEHGADVNALTKKQETVLHYGAYGGDANTVEYLLDLGLSVTAREEDGSTTLHNAAFGGEVSTLQLLINRGADVHALNQNGVSPLHVCAENGHHEAVKYLIEQGIAVDLKDENGITALHNAALNGHVETMRVLLQLNADPHVQTKLLQSILHFAVQGSHIEALQYALELGVDVNTRAQMEEELKTPLLLSFLGDDSKPAYDMAFALCSHGAVFSEDDRRAVLAKPTPWRSGLCTCVSHWIQEHAAGASSLTAIPIEVVNRGVASVKTYLADVARSTGDDRLHRCKICVVGPSEWGKTSLVQSIMSNQTFLTALKDRTVGIDLTTWVDSVINDPSVRLEITFWDFAGQDVYQAAHTLFYSERTLFVLVVDLDAYWKELQDAESKADRASEAQMNRFVSAKIFRWVRSIFAHQPDAQFVVMGTKANRLEDARVVEEIWDDLRDRLDHWKAAYAKGLDSELLPGRASSKEIKSLQSRLANLASTEWLVADVTQANAITEIRGAVQSAVTSNDLGFPMWKMYTQVLQSVVNRRDAAKNAVDARDRIEKSIVRYSTLRRQLLREIEELDRDACEQILRTLNDLGDVLWYEHDGAGVFKDCIILDPMLVIEVVREVVRHDFSSHNESPRDGRITHSLLSTFPLWKDMDVELMHAFKALLQHFQLAYPADAEVMLPESDIIVPAYWNAEESPSSVADATSQKAVDKVSKHRYCWEYEVPSELSETIFVQFAVQSYSSYLPRTIRGFCVEASCADFATSISLMRSDSTRDVLRIEVGGASSELAWHNMRFYLMKMEKVLEGYGGDVIWRFIVHHSVGGTSHTRYPVGGLVKAIEDAVVMGTDMDVVRSRMPWMPPDMDWFMRKSWNDITSFQQLQMNQLTQQKLEALRKLAIAGDTPRQFPALWSLEYIPEEQKVVLRMSSDLSGRCYHVPIEIDAGSPVLAQYASVFKAGVSLFATVVGNAISLPLVQNVIDATKSALDDKADNAVRVHNLMDKVDLLSTKTFDTRTVSKLSPGASMKLLRDLLKAYDDSLDVLEISDISNLECAVTASGEYVWAHAHEISALGDKITRCSAPPSTWNEISVDEPEPVPSVVDESPLKPDAPSPSATSTRSSSAGFKIGVSVETIEGLADWDWYKTYCKWQLYYRKSLKPLVVDVTPTNGDSSQAPSWRTMRTSIDAVTSVEMLRECRLMVQVKRRSRIGWTKVIGDGEVWLRDFFEGDLSPVDLQASVKVSLGSDRAVLIRLTNQA